MTRGTDALGGEVNCQSCPSFFFKNFSLPFLQINAKVIQKCEGYFHELQKSGRTNFQNRGRRESTVGVFRAGAEDGVLETLFVCSQK